jgi:hypothetical protein
MSPQRMKITFTASAERAEPTKQEKLSPSSIKNSRLHHEGSEL